jgi:sulfide:quinone oxidoreductase
MAHIVVLGAGIGGLPCAYELRQALGTQHDITVINEKEEFHFVPSNPWIGLGLRKRESITFEIRPSLEMKGINFIAKRAVELVPDKNRLLLDGGDTVEYDYLVIATGPCLDFDLVEGTGPQGFTQSICSISHAEKTYAAFQRLLDNPGHVVIGALPYTSCFGPAYEFVFILDSELRKRKLRDKVPITFVTPEPFIGHLGLNGVGDSRELLEQDFRNHHINWINNAAVTRVEAGKMHVDELDKQGGLLHQHELDFSFSMMMPAFRGVDVLMNVDGLTNERGFVLVDDHQRNPAYRNIYAAGVCIAIPSLDKTVVPTAAPKTGYMIESMVTAIVSNIRDEIAGKEGTTPAIWNAVCLADMGDTGAALVALPQFPPRNVAWIKKGRWVHMAKIAFEKYFIRKMKKGTSEPIYEKYILKMLGIGRLK